MKKQRYVCFALIVAVLLWAAYQAVEIAALKRKVDELKQDASVVETQRTVLLAALENPDQIIEVQVAPVQPDFIPLDIPMDYDLQKHAWEICQRETLPYPVFAAVIWGESGGIPDVPDNVNTDGSHDRGLCQINEVNWTWLREDHGLDVADPYDNIEAGAIILSSFWSKYPPEQALTAYAWGEQGMLDSGCTAPSAYRALEIAKTYGYENEMQ